jgi:LmbE family N-acetylglucosaminyl deacetylase
MSGNDSSDDDLVMGRTDHAQDPTRLHANDDGHSWGDDVGLSAVGRNRLECIRRFELRRAAGILGVSEMTCLGLPDGELSDHEAWLADALTAILRQRRAGVWCAATWRGDGHLDHEAVGRAAVFAARRAGAVLLEYPIWMWHWFPTCPATATPRYPSASQCSATSTTCPLHDRIPWASVHADVLDHPQALTPEQLLEANADDAPETHSELKFRIRAGVRESFGIDPDTGRRDGLRTALRELRNGDIATA